MLKITIEGPQGSGKTIVASHIIEAMSKAGYLVEDRMEGTEKETLFVMQGRKKDTSERA
jgi:Ni2+-binding GTPase involved in maturation of urease and hydrogenase